MFLKVQATSRLEVLRILYILKSLAGPRMYLPVQDPVYEQITPTDTIKFVPSAYSSNGTCIAVELST
jgi:hypothetical protein